LSSFKDRLIRAARLDVRLYEEVEADKGAIVQAMATVVLSSIAAGVGSIGKTGFVFGGIVAGAATALIGWYLWAYFTYIIGSKLLPEPRTSSNLGELLRTIGFSSSPGLIRVLGIIPGLSGVVYFIASIWMLVAMVIAVRQALDYQSTLRAVGVCAMSLIIQVLLLLGMMAIMGGARPF
jgi:hypothetical protein